MKDIRTLRKDIDSVDTQILDLFAQRMDCVSQVAEYKREHGLPVLDRTRERAKLADVASRAPENLGNSAQVLFSVLMDLAKADEGNRMGSSSKLVERIKRARRSTPELFPQTARVACQGVEGAYSQVAADRLFKHPDISYVRTFADVFEAVENGRCQYGVVPVENSTAGSVNQVYDLLARYKCHIVRTFRLKVDHCLLAKPGAELSTIRDIYSHEQAINQCSDFLASLGDSVRVHICENTAMAAQMVAESDRTDVAALSSRFCCELYGLKQLASGVQDMGNNYTRFACISKELQIFPGAERTSLMMTVGHKPGSLYRVLGRFFALDINLVKLESRPIPERDFDFMFYFDLECPVAAPEFSALISSLDDVCEEYRYLGSYSENV